VLNLRNVSNISNNFFINEAFLTCISVQVLYLKSPTRSMRDAGTRAANTETVSKFDNMGFSSSILSSKVLHLST